MKNALVIDDNRQLADGLCQMLDLFDIHAEAAYGSKTALLSLSSTTPDIIFLDINMPGLSGFEVLRFLQREPRLVGVPVIVVTSDDQQETRDRALAQGAFRVVIKPVTIDILESLISQFDIE